MTIPRGHAFACTATFVAFVLGVTAAGIAGLLAYPG